MDLAEVFSTKNESKVKKGRLTCLCSFGLDFVPTDVVVRVRVLRGNNLEQIGSACNPYLTCRFYGGYSDYISHKHDSVMDDDNPNFFQMFQSRVKMPGDAIRIEVPEITLPVIRSFWKDVSTKLDWLGRTIL